MSGFDEVFGCSQVCLELTMSFYELIVNVHGDEIYETVNVGGMFALAAASTYLGELAKAGHIPGITDVNVYDTVTITDVQLSGLFEHLSINSHILQRGKSFDVYLSEV